MRPFITTNDILRVDRHNMLASLEGFSESIREASRFARNITIQQPPQRVVICGMGPSAVGGAIIKEFVRNGPLPVLICEDYLLSSIVDKDTLCIIASYTGNTEETISMYSDAMKKGAQCIAVSSGGKIEAIAKENQHIHFHLPKGYLPRTALAYEVVVFMRIMASLGVVDDLDQTIKRAVKAMASDAIKESALEIAARLYGKVPVIYGTTSMAPAVYRWKQSINENAKVLVIANTFPSMEYNELSAYTHPLKAIHVVLLRSDDDHRKLKAKVAAAKELLKKQGVQITELNIVGECRFTRLLSAVHMGDWVSFYLAIRSGIDPSDQSLLDTFSGTIF